MFMYFPFNDLISKIASILRADFNTFSGVLSALKKHVW